MDSNASQRPIEKGHLAGGLLRGAGLAAGAWLPCLLEQGQHALLRLVGLGQHGSRGLRNDLRLGQVGGFRGVVGIHNPAT